MKRCGFHEGYCVRIAMCLLELGPWPTGEHWLALRRQARVCSYRAVSIAEWTRMIGIQRKRRHWKGADEHEELLKGE